MIVGVVGFGPGLYVDFSRFTFQVPIHGSADRALRATTLPNAAITTTTNMTAAFLHGTSCKEGG